MSAMLFSPRMNFAQFGPDFGDTPISFFPFGRVVFAQCECKSTTEFTVDSVTAVTALLCWKHPNCPKSYIIGWRTQGDHFWINRIVTTPDHCTSFTNNYPAVYEIRVATVCTNGDTSAYSEIFIFQTYPSCLPPTNLSTDNIGATNATAHWTPAADATQQNFWYRKVGNATWTTINISRSGTSYVIENLLPLTSYEWKVRSSCSDTDRTVRGAFSAVQTFTTGAMRMAMENSTPSSVYVYPNPTSNGSFMIAFPLNSSIDHAAVEITNVVGQVIYQQEVMINGGALSNSVKLNEGTPPGTYFVRIIAAEIVYSTQIVYHP